MKSRIAWTIAFAFLTLGLVASASAQGLHPCSIARVAGDWGYSLQELSCSPSGTAFRVLRRTYNVDWRGHVFGKQTSNAAGRNQGRARGNDHREYRLTGTFVVDIFDESGQPCAAPRSGRSFSSITRERCVEPSNRSSQSRPIHPCRPSQSPTERSWPAPTARRIRPDQHKGRLSER